MKQTKIIGMGMLLVMFILLISFNVNALGVTPARKTIDFQAGLEESVDLEILNNEHKDMRVAIFVEGDLAQYVSNLLHIFKISLSPCQDLNGGDGASSRLTR